MRVIQRYALLFGIFLILVPFVGFLSKEVTDCLVEKQENVYMERFVSKICRTGSITYEEYLLFHKALSQRGNQIEIRIDEYQREQDLEGKNYYPPVIWEELWKVLQVEKMYYFAEDSIVKVVVNRWDMMDERQIRRFGRISKGVANDT